MLNLEKPFRFAVLLILTLVIIRIMAAFSVFSDEIFPKISFYVSKTLASFSGLFPFSLGDALYSLLTIFLVFFCVKIILGIRKKNWIKIKRSISKLLISLILIVLIFHFSWGFNYYKTPLKESYNVEEISLDELKSLAEFYLNQSIKDRELVPEDNNGIFSKRLTDAQLKQEILEAAVEIQKIKELNLKKIPFPNLKKSLYSTGFSYLGVLGYYNPFTAEAQFNSKMPDTKLLFTQFHEVAHQWGYAAENEANFVGYLVGVKSKDKSFNYVANYKALRSLLNKIIWEDPDYVKSMLDRYSPKMKADREFEQEIQRKYNNRADDAFSMLNEAYLQLNNQDGLESYGQFIELLVGYHRKNPEIIASPDF